jgi:hypothetical protein
MVEQKQSAIQRIQVGLVGLVVVLFPMALFSQTLRLLASLIVAARCSSAAAGDTWFGLVPGAPGSFAVSLVTLSDSAQVLSTIGSVQLGADERAWPDGFRCIRGFCLFPTTTFAPRSFTSMRDTADPMKPAPPVTRIFI